MKIVGGTIATVESHPWVAAIFWRSKSKEKVFRCGGSLILSCWVLTAAHCFPDGYELRPLTEPTKDGFWASLLVATAQTSTATLDVPEPLK